MMWHLSGCVLKKHAFCDWTTRSVRTSLQSCIMTLFCHTFDLYQKILFLLLQFLIIFGLIAQLLLHSSEIYQQFVCLCQISCHIVSWWIQGWEDVLLLYMQMHRCFLLGRVLRQRTWHAGSSTTHPSCEPAAVPPIYRPCHFRRLYKCVPSVVRQGCPGQPLQRRKQQCGGLQGLETAHFHSICCQSGESLQIKWRMLCKGMPFLY